VARLKGGLRSYAAPQSNHGIYSAQVKRQRRLLWLWLGPAVDLALGVGLLVAAEANASRAVGARYLVYGIWLTGVGMAWGGSLVVILRRRPSPLAGRVKPPPLDLTVVPGGGVGTVLAPHFPDVPANWTFGQSGTRE